MLKGLISNFLATLWILFVLSGCDSPHKSPPAPPTPPPASPTPTRPATPAPKPTEPPRPEIKPETPKPAETALAKPVEAIQPKPEEKKATETVTPAPVQPVPPPTPPAATPAAPALAPNPALLNPALASEKAPEKFKAKFTTTKGDFVIEVKREWAPNGADRFYNLVKIGFLDDAAFFRNIQGFMVQFGINGDPSVSAKWRNANIQDDPVVGSNLPGYVTFAQTQLPHSRSTQFFINFGDNSRLDGMRFAPFGQVVEGMNVVQSLYSGYGEGAPGGRGPRQDLVQSQGNSYLKQNFPLLDYIKTATIVN